MRTIVLLISCCYSFYLHAQQNARVPHLPPLLERSLSPLGSGGRQCFMGHHRFTAGGQESGDGFPYQECLEDICGLADRSTSLYTRWDSDRERLGG